MCESRTTKCCTPGSIANSFSIGKEPFHEEAGSYVRNARLTRRRFALLQRQRLLRGAQLFSDSQIGDSYGYCSCTTQGY